MSWQSFRHAARFSLWLLLTFTAAAALRSAAADNFAGRFIKPGMWLDQEIMRRVDRGKFVGGFRQVGRTANARLFLPDPVTIDSVSADLTVLEARSTGPRPRAYIAGLYFNDGPAGPGVQGGVFAEISMAYAGADLDVRFEVGRCDDPQCLAFTRFVFDTTTFPNASLGSTHSLGLRWDGATSFTFVFDGTTATYDALADVSSVSPPGFPFRQLGARVFNPTGRGRAAMRIEIDDVHVNDALYDDFSAPMLDPSRWMGDRLEISRQIVRTSPGNGVLVSQIRQADSDGSNHMDLRRPKRIKHLSADVQVAATQIVAAGIDAARARARLSGYWYNAAAGGSSGETGEVQAEIRIIDRNRGGALDIQHFIARCDNPDCSLQTTCELNPAFGSTVAGRTHRLAIEWNPRRRLMTFGLDGTRESFDVAALGCAPTGPSRIPFKGIGTRVDRLDPGEEANITATFDNVKRR